MIYFSLDIETNGLCAGLNSMLSLGVAAINMETGMIVASRKWNMRPLPDLQEDKATMEWWLKFPIAYLRATENATAASDAIREFEKWVTYVCELYKVHLPVAAAWKPDFDIAFIRYYLHRFVGRDLFGRSGSGLNIKTLAAITLGQSFTGTQIGDVPAWLKGGADKHSHDALEDACEQARVLYNARKKLDTLIPGGCKL